MTMPKRIWATPIDGALPSGTWVDRQCNADAREFVRADIVNGLAEALTPLTENAKERCADAPEWPDHEQVSITVSIGDLRRARAALAALEDQP